MRRAQKMSLLGAVALASSLVTPPTLAADMNCANPATVDAFTVRDLQSRLTVAGLACGQRTSYNAFVKAYESDLGRSGRNLVAHFRAGGNGVRALDSHVTHAANAASLWHSKDSEAFCAESARLFRDLLSESKRSLMQVARTAMLPSVQKPVVCTAEASTPADDPETSLVNYSAQ
ncbi:MAG: hypothetical protein RJS98_08500 [Rhodospirillaceae bacterium]